MDHFILSRLFRVGRSTAHLITHEVAGVIWEKLAGTYMPVPDKASWQQYASEFYNLWQLPNCCGAIDGKHVVIQCPPNAGSLFFNYKKQHSIILLAVCDANYNFVAVDIGAYGGNSDGSVFSSSEIGHRMRTGEIDFPPTSCLPNSEHLLPHFIVGDAAFPLAPNLMRPYPGRYLPEEKENFNYRLSRARRTIENTFGIMVARWRILKLPLVMSSESAEIVTQAVVVLHNFVKRHAEHAYTPNTFVDHFDRNGECVEGEWRAITDPLQCIAADVISRNHNASRNAYQNRDCLAQYLLQNSIS